MPDNLTENLHKLRALTLPRADQFRKEPVRRKEPSLRQYQRRYTNEGPIKTEALLHDATAAESLYCYEEPPPYPFYSDKLYRALRSVFAMQDLLMLCHILESPWDHAFRAPPIYHPMPKVVRKEYQVVEIE